ncbi:protein kinase [Cystoisospora suis]|uniref:non-specific serine/threonine protein kinase n=1 Tax=Cystoisospora suis TaxID=483139 RepID=A0A2C6KMS6_9APIC|nr:protein kinase [Cystoisospora suis]
MTEMKGQAGEGGGQEKDKGEKKRGEEEEEKEEMMRANGLIQPTDGDKTHSPRRSVSSSSSPSNHSSSSSSCLSASQGGVGDRRTVSSSSSSFSRGFLLYQGAEARLFLVALSPWRLGVIKQRLRKLHIHPELDWKLHIHRMQQEVRAMVRCRKAGVDTPQLLWVHLPKKKNASSLRSSSPCTSIFPFLRTSFSSSFSPTVLSSSFSSIAIKEKKQEKEEEEEEKERKRQKREQNEEEEDSEVSQKDLEKTGEKAHREGGLIIMEWIEGSTVQAVLHALEKKSHLFLFSQHEKQNDKKKNRGDDFLTSSSPQRSHDREEKEEEKEDKEKTSLRTSKEEWNSIQLAEKKKNRSSDSGEGEETRDQVREKKEQKETERQEMKKTGEKKASDGKDKSGAIMRIKKEDKIKSEEGKQLSRRKEKKGRKEEEGSEKKKKGGGNSEISNEDLDDDLIEEEEEEEEEETSSSPCWRGTPEQREVIERIARAVGRSIATMHNAQVVHGDLTTSNVLLRSPSLSSSSPIWSVAPHSSFGIIEDKIGKDTPAEFAGCTGEVSKKPERVVSSSSQAPSPSSSFSCSMGDSGDRYPSVKAVARVLQAENAYALADIVMDVERSEDREKVGEKKTGKGGEEIDGEKSSIEKMKGQEKEIEEKKRDSADGKKTKEKVRRLIQEKALEMAMKLVQEVQKKDLLNGGTIRSVCTPDLKDDRSERETDHGRKEEEEKDMEERKNKIEQEEDKERRSKSLKESEEKEESPSHPFPSVCLIDFGLSSTSTLPEDKAVDLFVLERAVSSSHVLISKLFLSSFFSSYGQVAVGASSILSRLDAVRLRGRKRLMIG